MKKFTFLLSIMLLSSPLYAQQETLFDSEIESGGYGGPVIQFGEIVNGSGIFFGGQGGWIINHMFVIGGKGYALVNEVDIPNAQNLKLEFACGGILLEYIISSDQVLHFSVGSMIGAGGVKYAIKDHELPHVDVNYGDDGFIVLEPGAHVILNVAPIFRISLGANYRFISGVEYGDLSNSDLSGISAQIALKFGAF